MFVAGSAKKFVVSVFETSLILQEGFKYIASSSNFIEISSSGILAAPRL